MAIISTLLTDSYIRLAALLHGHQELVPSILQLLH